ncbi:hypothetical protein Q7P37_007360 [Cladosporium fusiforme]
MKYPTGTTPLPYSPAPVPSLESLPSSLTSPKRPTTSKNIFAFWHSGIENLPPYLLRNVIAWYRRFSPLGCTIYVLNTTEGSPLNVSNFLDTSDPTVVPAIFAAGGLTGSFASQHTSDLTRYPLLLKYGGLYLDVGILQFGDWDRLWTEHIGNAASPFDFAGFTLGAPPEGLSIPNFAFMATPNNPLVLRAHKILLKLWEGKTSTAGMHKHPLVSHVPLMAVPEEVTADGNGTGNEGTMPMNDHTMTDYAIQIQAMGSAQRWLDPEDGWDGPKYVREKCWLYNMVDKAYVSEQLCGWSGQRAFDLLSQTLPGEGERESAEQALARRIVETSISQSWCLKLMHGFSAQLFGGDTLGILWRKNAGSDAVEGTYAAWLRWAQVNCTQEELLAPLEVPCYEPTMIASMSDFLGR